MNQPFTGELMTCVVCELKQRSDPANRSNWRAIELADGTRYYACPAHFPADGATSEAFKNAYTEVFMAVVLRYRQAHPDSRPQFKSHTVDGETEKVND